MPTRAGETACVAELMRQPTALLLLRAAYYTDLITEFATFLGQRVNMQTRRLGLWILSTEHPNAC